jgi:septal ring factor EnvC (AmiA/AmiB activator)
MLNEDLESRIGLVLLPQTRDLAAKNEELQRERTELMDELEEIKIELGEKQRLEAELEES